MDEGSGYKAHTAIRC